MKGLSGVSNDMRVLLTSQDSGAALAIDHFAYRCGLHAGALAAALGGLDAFASPSDRGINFCTYGRHATRVELLLFEASDAPEPFHAVALCPHAILPRLACV